MSVKDLMQKFASYRRDDAANSSDSSNCSSSGEAEVESGARAQTASRVAAVATRQIENLGEFESDSIIQKKVYHYDQGLRTGLLERKFQSSSFSRANRYNLQAGSTCVTCLFCDKGKCVWHERAIDERPWVMLCGGVYWQEKPPHMRMSPEDRVFPFQVAATATAATIATVDQDRRSAPHVPATATAATIATVPEGAIFAKHAAKYARKGFLVYGLIKGTTAPHRDSHAFYDATGDLDLIAAHAETHPADNIAVRTGKEGGHTQIDIDPRNGGFETLAAHEREGRILSLDAFYETPAGGLHALFEYCPELQTGSNRLGPGIDIVNDGAGAPVPPSVRSDGRYAWKAWPSSGIFPPVPKWCIELVRADRDRKEAERAESTVKVDPAKISEKERIRYEGAARSVLKRSVERLGKQAKPGRGRLLFASTGFLAPYIRGKFIKEDKVRAEFEEACETNGLAAEDGLKAIRRTMDEAFDRSKSQLPDLAKLGDRPYPRAA